MFGSALHLRVQTLGAQVVLKLLAHLFDGGLALGALLVQPLGDLAVGFGLQKAKGQVFKLPLHFPNAQAVGQGRKYLQRLGGQARRQRPFAGGKVAQGLQARGQAQHHHPQVARKRQQHLAHALGLRGGGLRHGCGLAAAAGGILGNARHALQAHQLGGLDRQVGKAVAKGFGDHLVRLVQVLAGVDQIAGRLHGLRAANGRQDGGHRVGMGQDVFAGIEQRAREQRLGKGARAQQCVGLRGQAVGGGRSQGRGAVAGHVRAVAFHGLRGRSGIRARGQTKSPPAHRSGRGPPAWARGRPRQTRPAAPWGRAASFARRWRLTANPSQRPAPARSGR